MLQLQLSTCRIRYPSISIHRCITSPSWIPIPIPSSNPTTQTPSSSTTRHHYSSYTSLQTPTSIAKSFIEFPSNQPINNHPTILQNFLLFPNFISQPEHDTLQRHALNKLKRLSPTKQNYESGHFDKVISQYRECSVSSWGHGQLPHYSNSTQFDIPLYLIPIFDKIHSLFPANWNWLPIHILDLSPEGYIGPHVDHVGYSGNVVAGICLGSDAIMAFRKQPENYQSGTHVVGENDNPILFKALLPKNCFYVMRGMVRYELTHEIPSIESGEHTFHGRVIPRDRRISILFRDALPNKQQQL